MGEGAVFEGQHLDIGEHKNGCLEMEEMLFLLRGDGRGKACVYNIVERANNVRQLSMHMYASLHQEIFQDIFQLERKVFLYHLFNSENNAHYCFIFLLQEY